jgi:hypothetical protein
MKNMKNGRIVLERKIKHDSRHNLVCFKIHNMQWTWVPYQLREEETMAALKATETGVIFHFMWRDTVHSVIQCRYLQPTMKITYT